MRTLTTGAAALLIAAIVGMLALAGVQAQEPAAESDVPRYSTPNDLRVAANAFVTKVDLADVDGTPTDDKTDGRIVIRGIAGDDTIERALEWLAWQEDREASGKATLSLFEEARALKDTYDRTKASCEAWLGGTCVWSTDAPVNRDPATVLVWAQREDRTTYTVRVLEIAPRGDTGWNETILGDAQLVTLRRDGNWRTQPDTLHTLRNGTTVGVTLRQLPDGRVEFAVSSDRNRDGRYGYADGGALPDQRFAPVNARFERPMLSSPVSIEDTPTTWWLSADGS